MAFLKTGFYVGPGDWLYYVKAVETSYKNAVGEIETAPTGRVSSISIAYSPTSRAWINRALDASTASKVQAELSSSGRYLGTQTSAAKQAYAKIRPESATAGTSPAPSSGGSYSSGSSYTPAPSAPAPAATSGGLWSQVAPYAPYALLGVSAVVALYLVLTPPKRAAPPVAA